MSLQRDPAALETRGISWFDEFVPLSRGTNCTNHPDRWQFRRGQYVDCGLSGLLCLQYAINHGARAVHVVGCEGYSAVGPNYFNPDKPTQQTAPWHNERIIRPLTQAIVRACPEVRFTFYGDMRYDVTGPNVRIQRCLSSSSPATTPASPGRAAAPANGPTCPTARPT